MTKIGGDVAPNGKYLKPANYSPPRLARILLNQLVDTGLRPGASLPHASEKETESCKQTAGDTTAVFPPAGRKPQYYTECEGGSIRPWDSNIDFKAFGVYELFAGDRMIIPLKDGKGAAVIHTIFFTDNSLFSVVGGWVGADANCSKFE